MDKQGGGTGAQKEVIFAYVNFSDLKFDDFFLATNGGRKIYEFAPISPKIRSGLMYFGKKFKKWFKF